MYADRVGNWAKPDGASWIGSAAFEGFCRSFFTCYCPLTVKGRDYLPEGPFLLCSNHASHMDSAALMTASGRRFRTFALLGASDYFFHKQRIRWLVMPFMNVIPIDRRPAPKTLAACLTMCHRFVRETGGSLILYPEGTRSSDGRMRAFRSGVGLFAIELDLPLVPAFIEGTHNALPKGHSMPRPARVTVRFGPPLAMAALSRTAEPFRKRRRLVVDQLARSILLLSRDAGGISELLSDNPVFADPQREAEHSANVGELTTRKPTAVG
jgi:1-acyl-sn-glycerol-3-phosphate acyltransferase